MPDSSEIPGLDQLKANFQALEYGLQRKILMAGVRKGAAIIVDAAAARAPRLQAPHKGRVAGALAANMMSRIWDSGPSEVTARIGPSKSEFYGRYAEEGTEKEMSKPFLRPAFDEKQEEALAAVGVELWNGIVKELNR